MNSSSRLYFHRYCKKLGDFLAFICITLIMGLRPVLGPALCKFEPSCTKFAVQQFQQESFLKAIFKICKRLISCSPLPQLKDFFFS